MNATAPCPCEVKGLINALEFWEWNFNDFPCTINATKAADFKGQEKFIRDFCHDRKSLGKNSQHLKIQGSEFKSYLRITLKLGSQQINWGKDYYIKQNDE